jgi:hypothetical protein
MMTKLCHKLREFAGYVWTLPMSTKIAVLYLPIPLIKLNVLILLMNAEIFRVRIFHVLLLAS